MKRVAVFLDAGYFWVQLCKVILWKYNGRTEVIVDYEALRKLMLTEVERQFGADCHFLRANVTPGVVAAQGVGLRVHLLSIGSSTATSHYLAAEADFKRSWGSDETAQFAKGSTKATESPTATVTQAMIDAFAKIVREQSLLEPHASLLPSMPSPDAKMLPREVDIFLLSTARQLVGRSLNEAEKRALRDAFKALL